MIEIVPNWHPIWVHFPIALFSMATAFFYWALPSRTGWGTGNGRSTLESGGGSGITDPTLITGYLAYNSVAHDGAGHQAMERHHMTAAWVVAALVAVAVVLAWLDRFRARGAGLVLTVVL